MRWSSPARSRSSYIALASPRPDADAFIAAARERLAALLAERRAAGCCTEIEQLDVVACEDGRHIMAYIYFASRDAAGDPELALFTLPAPSLHHFDDRRISEELLAS